MPISGRQVAAGRTAAVAALVVAAFALAACGDEGKDDAGGKATVVYEDEAIKPENRKAVEVVRKSRVLEQAADWVNTSVALPHDLVVKVTDKVPRGSPTRSPSPTAGRSSCPRRSWPRSKGSSAMSSRP